MNRTREMRLTATGVSTYALAQAARLQAETTGPQAGAVFSPAVLAALGVPADARVVSVNGVVVDSRGDADRALALRRPADVVHVRDGRRAYFVATARAAR